VHAPATLARRTGAVDVQLMAVRGAEVGEISYETDRLRFIGRGRSVAAPQALDDAAALSVAPARCSIRSPQSAIRLPSSRNKPQP